MPLKEFSGDLEVERQPRNLEVLRPIKTLKWINSKPSAEFWKQP